MNKIEIIYAQIECMADHAKNIRQMVDELMEQKQQSTQDIIDGRGLYRMRNGQEVVIFGLSEKGSGQYPAKGGFIINGYPGTDSWTRNGKNSLDNSNLRNEDIIEKIRSF